MAPVFGCLSETCLVSSAKIGEFDLDFLTSGIAIGSNDNILAVVANGTKLMAYSHFGNVVTTFDTSDFLKNTWGVHQHNDNIYVTDSDAEVIHVYNNDNDTWKAIHTNGECNGICVSGDKQQLLMTSNIDDGIIYSTLVDGSGTNSVFVKHPDIKYPTGIAARNDMVVVGCDVEGSNNIVCFDATGRLKFTHGGNPFGGGENQLNCPIGVAIDRDMNIIVADENNRRITLLSENGELLGSLQMNGFPLGLALMENGTLLVSQEKPNKIIKLRYAVGRK